MGELVREQRAVAITGARTYLGTELIRYLEEEPRYGRVLALDVAPPPAPVDKARFFEVDLTIPAVVDRLVELLTAARVDTFVHAAFLSGPTHAQSWAHALQKQGTAHALAACARARPRRFVLVSTTLVYGASPHNPNLMPESTPLVQHSPSPFIADKVDAEEQVARFAAEHPEVSVTVLRIAPVLGPTVVNFFTRFFSRPVAPVLMGYDPLIQLIHERDAAAALRNAVDDYGARGVFNLAAPGVLPYTSVLALMGKIRCPIPRFVARPLSRALWATQLSSTPPGLLDFLRFLCVADTERARRELGFRPRHDIRHTILDYLGLEEGELENAQVYG
jgi:UDP-glucose 4-epimerase